MQSNIKTEVISDGGNIYASVARTVTHDDMDVNHRKMTPPIDPESDVGMYSWAIHSRQRNLLDISTDPPTMLAIRFGKMGDEEIQSCTGLSVTDHPHKGISILPRGVITDKRRVIHMKPINPDNHDEGTLIKVWPSAARRAYIHSEPVAGYFRVNGEHLFIHLGVYAEKKVYIEKCGVLDADGNKYIYDPGDTNMIKREEVGDGSSDYYGEYKLTDGYIVADALERCINDGFNRKVVTVVYEQNVFHIAGADDLITYMNVPAYSDSTAGLLGLAGKNSKHLDMMNLEGKRVYMGEGMVSREQCEINSEGYIVTDIPWTKFNDTVKPHTEHRTLYFLDTTASSDVQILIA